jgi:septal ring factor EnvC (AmiA/AmiB activator)
MTLDQWFSPQIILSIGFAVLSGVVAFVKIAERCTEVERTLARTQADMEKRISSVEQRMVTQKELDAQIQLLQNQLTTMAAGFARLERTLEKQSDKLDTLIRQGGQHS